VASAPTAPGSLISGTQKPQLTNEIAAAARASGTAAALRNSAERPRDIGLEQRSPEVPTLTTFRRPMDVATAGDDRVSGRSMNVQSKFERQDQLDLYRRALGSTGHYEDELYSFGAGAAPSAGS
jgi:hypothetical protein